MNTGTLGKGTVYLVVLQADVPVPLDRRVEVIRAVLVADSQPPSDVVIPFNPRDVHNYDVAGRPLQVVGSVALYDAPYMRHLNGTVIRVG